MDSERGLTGSSGPQFNSSEVGVVAPFSVERVESG